MKWLPDFATWDNIKKTWSEKIEALPIGGPSEQSKDRVLELTFLPSLEEILQETTALPGTCGSLFRPEPLRDEDLLIGREQSLQKLEEAFGHWISGFPCSISVIGPQGGGKSSLVNCFVKRAAPRFELVRSGMGERLRTENALLEWLGALLGVRVESSDPQELIEQILSLEPRIIVLDGGHNLLLRVIGGRRVADLFFYILLSTRRKHLWILTCRFWPWKNLDRHVNASNFFTHQIDAGFLDAKEQRQALEIRAEKAGLELVFAEHEETHNKEPQQAQDQEKAAERFYRDIFVASGGNMRAALYFWHLGYRAQPASGKALLQPPGQMNTSFIRNLDLQHLLTLAEVAGHGTLSVAEHREIFRSDAIASRLSMQMLQQSRLLIAEGETDYSFDPITQNGVTDTLEQLHLLY